MPDERTATDTTGRAEVAIVVLNWNGWRDTLACLESLKRSDYPSTHLIVVDNGSEDDSARRIREAHPGVTVLETGSNLGFAGGCNVGIRHALERGCGFVWLLNNDTQVRPKALTAMMETLLAGNHAVVGSVVRTLSEPVSVEAWGGGWTNRGLGTTRRAVVEPERPLDYIAGTSMLVRREVFEGVGLLDESYFFYLEDVDFCLRARARGWSLGVAPDAVVFHERGASVGMENGSPSERADAYHAHSTGVFLGRHAGGWKVPAATIRLLGFVIKRVLRGQARRVPLLTKELLRGLAIGGQRRATAGRRERAPLPPRTSLRTPTP